MKNVFILLVIALSITSCKKDKIHNCIQGKWTATPGNTAVILEYTDDEYIYFRQQDGFRDVKPYKINNKAHLIVNGVDIGKVTCGGESFSVELTDEHGTKRTVNYYKLSE